MIVVVHGRPAPQGSKRHVGNGRMIEMSKYVGTWRDDVKAAARAVIEDWVGWVPLDGPLVARMVFTIAKPASAPKRRRTWPSTMPDLSKLIRSTEDALKDAGAIKDDARIVEYSRAAKVYPSEDEESLDVPGARISINRLAADQT